MATADCCKTLDLVNVIISFAISASRIREFASSKFIMATPNASAVKARRFCCAPAFARYELTMPKEVSSAKSEAVDRSDYHHLLQPPHPRYAGYDDAADAVGSTGLPKSS